MWKVLFRFIRTKRPPLTADVSYKNELQFTVFNPKLNDNVISLTKDQVVPVNFILSIPCIVDKQLTALNQ